MKYLKILILAVVISGVLSSDKVKGEEISLDEYLGRLARKERKYFTVEEACVDWKDAKRMTFVRLAWPKEPISLEQHLKHLSDSITNIIVIPNKLQPSILHIVDKRLMKLPMYPLDETLNGIMYTGTVNGLIEEIRRLGSAISIPDTKLANDKWRDEKNVNVSISESGIVTAREVVSEGLPLKRYNKILWKSLTCLSEKPETEIRFGGQRSDEKPGNNRENAKPTKD